MACTILSFLALNKWCTALFFKKRTNCTALSFLALGEWHCTIFYIKRGKMHWISFMTHIELHYSFPFKNPRITLHCPFWHRVSYTAPSLLKNFDLHSIVISNIVWVHCTVLKEKFVCTALSFLTPWELHCTIFHRKTVEIHRMPFLTQNELHYSFLLKTGELHHITLSDTKQVALHRYFLKHGDLHSIVISGTEWLNCTVFKKRTNCTALSFLTPI